MATAPTTARERPRLKERYDAEWRAQLKDQLGLANIMQVPRLEKIVVNMGVGRATQQASLLEGAVRDLTEITGQKPLVTKAKQSIAGFKLREGNAIGVSYAFKQMMTLVGQVADSSASVLIQGESGTGKELAARAIHDRSPRRQGPFVAVNCAALPETLLESELFG